MIEPGEIESLLSELPGIQESVIKVHTFEESDVRLVAFLHVDNEFRMTDGEISEILAHQLPANMIPSFYQKQNVFPRMPNGKINIKALLFSTPESDIGNEKPLLILSDTESQLLAIWESVLRLGKISKYDNFFEIGGNSLLAIRVVNKIREEIGFNLLLNDLLNNMTIIQLGEFIDSHKFVSNK